MTETNVQEVEDVRREPETLDEQATGPKGKGAARRRRERTPEEIKADKEKKAKMEEEAEASKPTVPGKRVVVEGKQSRIPGTSEPVPPKITEKANEYANTLHERQRLQQREATLKADLIDLMKEHNFEQIETDDSYINFVHEEKDKIKVKLKKDEDD